MRNLVRLLVSLAALNPVAMMASLRGAYPSDYREEPERDPVATVKADHTTPATRGVGGGSPDGRKGDEPHVKRFDYSKYAFQPKSWEELGLSLQLVPWTGRNVIFFTTEEHLDPGLMGLWVSRLDAGWDLYADLTGRRPTPFREFEGVATRW